MQEQQTQAPQQAETALNYIHAHSAMPLNPRSLVSVAQQLDPQADPAAILAYMREMYGWNETFVFEPPASAAPEPFEVEHARWTALLRTIQQWTWVIWGTSEWTVYRQVPDPAHPYRVISTKVASGKWPTPREMPRAATYDREYRQVQREIGAPYATDDAPLILKGGHLAATVSA